MPSVAVMLDDASEAERSRPTQCLGGWASGIRWSYQFPSLPFQSNPCGGELRPLFVVHLGKLETEGAEGDDGRGGHDQAGKPLVVCRDHVPWRIPGRGRADHVLVGFRIIVPVAPLFDVGGGKLPVLGGYLQSLQKPLFVLLSGQVQE